MKVLKYFFIIIWITIFTLAVLFLSEAKHITASYSVIGLSMVVAFLLNVKKHYENI